MKLIVYDVREGVSGYQPGDVLIAYDSGGVAPPEVMVCRVDGGGSGLHRIPIGLIGAAQDLREALKGILHLALEMKGTHNLSQSELRQIETAKEIIAQAEGPTA